MRKASERTAERGQATVEFAIVLPLFLLLIAGLIAFGTAFNYWISLNHLSNEGSRWASVDTVPAYTDQGTNFPTNTSPSAQELKDFITSQVLTQELRGIVGPGGSGSIDLCFSGAGPTPQVGDSATVTIKAPYSFPLVSGFMDMSERLLGNGGSSGLGAVNLTGSSTVRFEQAPRPDAGWQPCLPP